jgi:osmotically-inducible protein OsmY
MISADVSHSGFTKKSMIVGIGCLFLGACSLPGTLIGVGATAGIAAAEERGVETSIDDLKIDLEIKRRLVEEDEALVTSISTEVHDGRVLLTGIVDTVEARIFANRVAWETSGVSEVINELRVAGDGSLVQASKDIFISTQLRTRIMGDREIQAINYSIETVRGTIYLLGIAQSSEELERVINHARNVSGVRNIIPYVRVKAPARAIASGHSI